MPREEPKRPSGKPSDQYYDPDEVWESALLRGVQKAQPPKPQVTEPAEIRTATFLIGPPASGKTQWLKPRVPMFGRSVEIDVNLIKPQLPEYDPKLDPLCHDESSYIGGDLLLRRAIEEGRHMIIEMTGKNSQKVLEIAKGLKEKGYRLEVYHMSVTPLNAAKRAYARFMGGGRFVDPTYVLDQVGSLPDATYDTLKNSGLIEKGASYDNNEQKEPNHPSSLPLSVKMKVELEDKDMDRTLKVIKEVAKENRANNPPKK